MVRSTKRREGGLGVSMPSREEVDGRWRPDGVQVALYMTRDRRDGERAGEQKHTEMDIGKFPSGERRVYRRMSADMSP